MILKIGHQQLIKVFPTFVSNNLCLKSILSFKRRLKATISDLESIPWVSESQLTTPSLLKFILEVFEFLNISSIEKYNLYLDISVFDMEKLVENCTGSLWEVRLYLDER